MEGKNIMELLRTYYGTFRGRTKGRLKEDLRWFGEE